MFDRISCALCVGQRAGLLGRSDDSEAESDHGWSDSKSWSSRSSRKSDNDMQDEDIGRHIDDDDEEQGQGEDIERIFRQVRVSSRKKAKPAAIGKPKKWKWHALLPGEIARAEAGDVSDDRDHQGDLTKLWENSRKPPLLPEGYGDPAVVDKKGLLEE